MKRILLAVTVLLFTVAASAQEQDKNPEGAYLPLFGHHQGKLLVASPGMPDIRFRQSVILLVEHNEKGAFGLIVNRVVRKMPLAMLFMSFGMKAPRDMSQVDIHYGGPVSPDSGFVLHTREHLFDGAYEVDGNVAVSTVDSVLRAMAQGKRPSKLVIVVGYTGWGAGQLEHEMRRGDWYMAPAGQDILFDDEHANKWKRAMERRFRVL
ncbi:MAG: YqgE/AlgH family protein [Nitrospinae bacterium]|nr:YqgE/AlgH family protein [Nitrospinota bacterium]